MKKFNILIAIFCILATASCDKFLDVEPTNSADATKAVTSVQDAELVINGLMSAMLSSSYYGRNLYVYADAKGGDMTIGSQGRGLDNLYTFNHSYSSGNYSGFWNVGYDCIYQINNLLENIKKIEDQGTLDDFTKYKGQALTARALIYFDLVRLYGKPYNYDKSSYGVPKVTTTLEYNAQPTRATVEEIYNLIIDDLEDGETLLEGTKGKVNGKINYYANKAIQARVYLYMENYDAALDAAEKIIGDKKYTLYTNENWVSSWANQFGSESIFELGVYESENDLGTGSLGAYQSRAGHLSSNVLGYFMASDYFLNRLGEDDTDIRWGIMSYDELSHSYKPKDYDTDRYGACYKYLGSTSLSGDGKSTASAVNIKVIRLSEIYLIAAEAALKSSRPDPKGLAAGYLQEIRKRSPNLSAATAENITMQMIMDERSKELYGEGHRFFDMIRWNQSITFNDEIPGINPPQRSKTIDRTFNKAILPISEAELNANEAIRSQQNPGY